MQEANSTPTFGGDLRPLGCLLNIAEGFEALQREPVEPESGLVSLSEDAQCVSLGPAQTDFWGLHPRDYSRVNALLGPRSA